MTDSPAKIKINVNVNVKKKVIPSPVDPDYVRMSKGIVTELPDLDMPDGPTWNDRVKRAEKIAIIVAKAREDLEEAFLDLREGNLGSPL